MVSCLRSLLPLEAPISSPPHRPKHWTLMLRSAPPDAEVQAALLEVGRDHLLAEVQRRHNQSEAIFMLLPWQKALRSYYSKKRSESLFDRHGGLSTTALLLRTAVTTLPTITTDYRGVGVLLRQQRYPLPSELIEMIPGLAATHLLSRTLLDELSGFSGFLGVKQGARMNPKLRLACLGLCISPLALEAILQPALSELGLLDGRPLLVASVCSGVSIGLVALDNMGLNWRLLRFHERDPALAAVHSRGWARHHATWHRQAVTLPSDSPQENLLILSPDCGPFSHQNRHRSQDSMRAALAELASILSVQLSRRQPQLVIFESTSAVLHRARLQAANFMVAALRWAGGSRYTWKGRLLCPAHDLGAHNRRNRLFIVGSLRPR